MMKTQQGMYPEKLMVTNHYSDGKGCVCVCDVMEMTQQQTTRPYDRSATRVGQRL